MKKDLLSIAELARLRKVSSETLRHYDRIDLLKPDYVDVDTQYRYYSIRQYEKLGTIIELRQLGMPLKDIMDYFRERNFRKSVDILKAHHKILRDEIKEKIQLEKILRRKMFFIKGLLASPPEIGVVFEKKFPKRYVITFGVPSGGPKQRAFAVTKLESYLIETAPILASDRVGVYTDERILEVQDGIVPGCSMILTEEKLVKDSDHDKIKVIPEGDYACMYYNGGLEEYHPSLEVIKDYLNEHELIIDGDILQIYKIDVTLTNDPTEKVMEIQVPIKKKT